MKITMLETRLGSEDGFGLTRYEKGRTYDVADTMARHFIRQGYAQEPQLAHMILLTREIENVFVVKPDNK